MHHPSIFKLETLHVQSGEREEALRCIETQECMLYMVYRPPRYHPHFSPAYALFLNNKVHNSSSSLCLCTWKIIGHPEWCRIACRRDHLTLKIEFTGRPPMLYPQKHHNLAMRTPFELHHPPKWSQLNVVCVHHLLRQHRQHFRGRIQVEKSSFRWFYLWRVLYHPSMR